MCLCNSFLGKEEQRLNRNVYFFISVIPGLVITIIASVFVMLALRPLNLYPHNNILGIASDVIDCAFLDGPQSLSYSTVNITQVNSDKQNDNHIGIPVDVFSVRRSAIKYHTYVDNHKDFELTLSRSGVNRFIVPYNYFNRPWYMRKNSKISLQFFIDFIEKPTEAYAYILKGEDIIIDFLTDLKSEPNYEHKLNVFDNIRNFRVSEIQHNDYYYVGMHINGKKGTKFSCNITFNFMYIDADDYDMSDSKHMSRIGDSVLYPIDSLNRNATLCYIHPLGANSFESPSIHFNVVYIRSLLVLVPLLLIPFMLFMVYVGIVLATIMLL